MRTQTGEGIIGRDHPAAMLRAEIERAAQSHGGLVLVTGEAGIGKTTLVTRAAEEARRHGALVLGGACWESDSAPGYWPWVQVIRGLRRGAGPEEWAAVREAVGGGLDVLLGDAATRHSTTAGHTTTVGHTTTNAGEGEPAGDREPADAFRHYDAVTTALVSVSQHRPVVVILDDLHWADSASLRLLEFAAQHTWFERLLLIGTYRDVEVESAGHPLRPLMMPLVAKATTVTLTGLARPEVGTLIARTAGREPEPDLVTEVHRRTGGNPFFVEQTARLWRADGSIAAIPPGVRDAVRRRLSLLPERVVEALTAACVLGREFHRRLLAACATAPVAEVDRLLDRAVSARLVTGRQAGRFMFAHDLVREALYATLDTAERRRRHAAVIRAVDRDPGLGDLLFPADLARHAYLAGADIPPDRAVDLLVAAGRDASVRLAGDEAIGHFRRALERVDDPVRRSRVTLEFASELSHCGTRGEAWQHFHTAAELAREHDNAEILARVALTVRRREPPGEAEAKYADELLREAHDRLVGGAAATAPPELLVRDLIAGTEALARQDRDDEALSFSLSTRHDTIWGLGTAAEREALTSEMVEVARRTGDTETELIAQSLRWVTLVEQGDPRYLDQFQTFVSHCARLDLPRLRLCSMIDSGVIATLHGRFAEAEAHFAEVPEQGDHGIGEFTFIRHHLYSALLLLQGRFEELDARLGALGDPEYPHLDLLRALSAVEQGDAGPALRHIAEVEAGPTPYPRSVMPLFLRLKAQAAAVLGDAGLCAETRAALAPHRGEWTVSLFGCDISGPVDLWIALLDAAQERWDDAIAGFTAARDAAERLGARPWSVTARSGLAGALEGRRGTGDPAAAAALRAEVERDATALGMPHLVERARRRQAPAVAPDRPVHGYEFRRDGAVWRLGYGGTVVHLPDAKGLRDLHQLLSRPGAEIPAVELLDPAAGPELVAARRMGGDPLLDDEAKASYKRRLGQLDGAIDDAARRGDDSRAAELDRERHALLGELRAAAGLAGRSRRLGDEAERARKTVTARIRDALRRLDERHPGLAAHLRESVSTGATCRYAPAPPIAWRL
jgi:hypothetical protein